MAIGNSRIILVGILSGVNKTLVSIRLIVFYSTLVDISADIQLISVLILDVNDYGILISCSE